MTRYRIQLLNRFLKFFTANLGGTIIDTTALFMLAEFVFASSHGRYLIAPAISFELVLLTNYAFSYFWIWRDRVAHTVSDFLTRFLSYHLNSQAVFLLKLALLAGIGYTTLWHPVLCNLLALSVTGMINFLMQERIIFSSQRDRHEA